jgi:hypothetical protein
LTLPVKPANNSLPAGLQLPTGHPTGSHQIHNKEPKTTDSGRKILSTKVTYSPMKPEDIEKYNNGQHPS